MADISHIFRAYDIRGKVPDEFNSQVAYEIGLTLASEYKSTTLSSDVRKTSMALSGAFISGFLEGGGDVSFQGMASFGTALYAGMEENTDITALITASHLPPEFNGIKFYFSDGTPLDSDGIQKIYKNLLNSKPVEWREYGVVENVDHSKDYVEFYSSKFSLSGDILIDCGGGAMSLIVDRLFKEVGFSPKTLFCSPNPAFTDRPSEPKPENITKLEMSVASGNYKFGAAFDGDGDRVTIVDDTGRVLTPEEAAIVIARNFMEEHGKALLLANVACSKVLEDVLGPEGVTVKRIPVGHTYLVSHAKELGADIGVEHSGHFFIPSIVGFDDAVVVPMLIGEILGDTKLSEVISDIPKYPQKEFGVVVPDTKKFEIMSKIKMFVSDSYENVDFTDGVKILYKDGWALIRPSNTSAKLRVMIEGNTDETVERIEKDVRSNLEGFL